MYDAELKIEGEDGATVADFVREVTNVNEELNASWAKVKAELPADEQEAAEAAVRAVLHA